MIRLSAGTARVLGFNRIKMETPPTCAYLMIGDRCSGSCLYCAQSQKAAPGDNLSRITWKPEVDDEVMEAITRCHEEGDVKRVCFQVTRGDHSFERTKNYLIGLKKQSGVPICISINGIDADAIGELLEAGADKIAISFDAATPELFKKIKGEEWDDLWNLYVTASDRYPGRIVIHLIIGLGETEKEAAKLIEKFYERHTPVSLFAFTPLPGTPMSRVKPPKLDKYRRMQVVHYLVRKGFADSTGKGVPEKSPDVIFTYNDKDEAVFNKKVRDFLMETISGEAFETWGCPDCNRPLYNEKPGQIPYNYPRSLTEEERVGAVDAAVKS